MTCAVGHHVLGRAVSRLPRAALCTARLQRGPCSGTPGAQEPSCPVGWGWQWGGGTETSVSDGKGCGTQRWADPAVFCCLLTAQPQMQVQSQKSVKSRVQKAKFMARGPKRGPLRPGKYQGNCGERGVWESTSPSCLYVPVLTAELCMCGSDPELKTLRNDIKVTEATASSQTGRRVMHRSEKNRGG